jgi:hypothetical protein
MTSPRRLTTSPVPLALRFAGIAAIALFGITCRDRDPMGPGLPSQASLAVAPQMQQPALAGGPSFLAMRSVRGVLTPIGGGAAYDTDARPTPPAIRSSARCAKSSPRRAAMSRSATS